MIIKPIVDKYIAFERYFGAHPTTYLNLYTIFHILTNYLICKMYPNQYGQILLLNVFWELIEREFYYKPFSPEGIDSLLDSSVDIVVGMIGYHLGHFY